MDVDDLLPTGGWKPLLLVVGLLLAVALFVWVRIATLCNQRDTARLERDQARLETKELRIVLEGQRQAQEAQLALAKADAERLGASTRALVQGLEATLPKTDAEARAWALGAAGRIGR